MVDSGFYIIGAHILNSYDMTIVDVSKILQISEPAQKSDIYYFDDRKEELNMVDITTLSLEELEKDLQDSRNDISICEVALMRGIQHYSGGSVMERIKGNQHIIDVITKELNRRSSLNGGSK